MRDILKIARQVRKLYENRFNDQSLEGFCHCASVDILTAAIKSHIEPKPKLAIGKFNRWPHTWIEYREIIIDVTATQFPGIRSKILVTNINDPRYERILNLEGL